MHARASGCACGVSLGNGVFDQLSGPFKVQLGADVVSVALGGTQTDEQQFADLAVGVAVCDQLKYLALPRCQGIGRD